MHNELLLGSTLFRIMSLRTTELNDLANLGRFLVLIDSEADLVAVTRRKLDKIVLRVVLVG